jgi:MFS family permease
VGPILGGVLANAGLWRGVFLINIPIGVCALLVLFAKVPESRDEKSSGRIDYLGAALLAVGLAGPTYGLLSAPDKGFADPSVFGSLLLGLLAFAAFLVVEARSAHPMIPLGLFSSRTFSGVNLLTFGLYGALSAGTFFMSLNMVQAQNYRMDVAGLASLPFALILIALSRWAGGLVDKGGPRLPLIVGPAIAGGAFLFMAFSGLSDGPSHYWGTFFPGFVLLGIGMGITVAPLTTSVMSSVASHFAGTASGINNAVSRTAGVLAIAVVGAVALIVFSHALQTRTGPNAIRLAFVDAFRVVMLICTALAWIGAVLAGFIVERKFTAAA